MRAMCISSFFIKGELSRLPLMRLLGAMIYLYRRLLLELLPGFHLFLNKMGQKGLLVTLPFLKSAIRWITHRQSCWANSLRRELVGPTIHSRVRFASNNNLPNCFHRHELLLLKFSFALSTMFFIDAAIFIGKKRDWAIPPYLCSGLSSQKEKRDCTTSCIH